MNNARTDQTQNNILQAWDYLHADNLPQAETICRQMFQKEPENPDLLRCMAMIAKHKNDLQQCLQIVTKIVNLIPDSAADRQALGIIMRKTGHYDEAIGHLCKSLELGMDEQNIYPLLCKACFDKGDYRQATHYYHKSQPLYDFKNSLHQHVMSLKMVSARQYCESRKAFYRMVEPALDVRINLERHGEKQYFVPESFLACLSDVIVMPANFTVVAEERYLLYEGFDTNSRDSMLLLPPFHYKTEDGRVLADIPHQKQVIDQEAILFGGGPNFSHCVNDWFSKLYVLQNFPELQHLPLLVSASVIPPIRDLFAIFGIAKERILYVDQDLPLLCKKLWLPSLTHAFQFFSPRYPAFFQQTAARQAATAPQKHRLYLGRQKARYRKISNEREVIDLLETYGFQVVIPEELSMREQIDLFANAEAMVIPTGGGSASAMFAPPGSVFIDLTNPQIDAYQYEIAATLLGLQLHKVMGTIEKTNTGELPIDRDFHVPIKGLQSILKKYWNKR